MGCVARFLSDIGRVRVGESEGALFLYIFCITTACAGLFQYPIWTGLIGGTAIAAVNIAEQGKLRARFAAIGANDVLTAAHLTCLATGWLAGLAAWALGRFSWWAYWS